MAGLIRSASSVSLSSDESCAAATVRQSPSRRRIEYAREGNERIAAGRNAGAPRQEIGTPREEVEDSARRVLDFCQAMTGFGGTDNAADNGVAPRITGGSVSRSCPVSRTKRWRRARQIFRLRFFCPREWKVMDRLTNVR